MEDGDLDVDESISSFGLTSSDTVHLEKFIPQASRRGAQKVDSQMLSKAVSCFLKPLKQNAKSWCEVSLGSGETRRFFPMMVSYFCDTSKAKGVSVAWLGAQRQNPCVGCHSAYRNLVKGRKS